MSTFKCLFSYYSFCYLSNTLKIASENIPRKPPWSHDLLKKVKFPKGVYCLVSVFYCPDKSLLNIVCLFMSLFSSLNFVPHPSAACIFLFSSSLSFHLFSCLFNTSRLLPLTLLTTALWQLCKRVMSYHLIFVGGKKRLELQYCQPSSC